MSQAETLKSLETLLESFIDRFVSLKEKRLAVLDGINRLDDLSDQSRLGADITDGVGDWFAEHNRWLSEGVLDAADVRRINGILGGFRKQLAASAESSPAKEKIRREIDRWQKTEAQAPQKLVLKRGPEPASMAAPVKPEMTEDTIARFDSKLERLAAVFKDASAGKKHILSVADDLLKSAKIQQNKDALILSAFIIYYLKQNGYKVEPYVRKLKEAETLLREGTLDA